MDAVGDGADGLHVLLPQWLTARPDDPQPPGAAPALLTQVGHLHQLGGHQEGHGALLTAQHLPLKGDRVVRDTLAHVQQHPVGHSHSVSTLWVTLSQHTVGHAQSAHSGSHSVSTLWVTLSILWVTLSQHPVGHTQSAPCGSHSVSTLWVTLSQHPVGHTQSAPCGSPCGSGRLTWWVRKAYLVVPLVRTVYLVNQEDLSSGVHQEDVSSGVHQEDVSSGV